MAGVARDEFALVRALVSYRAKPNGDPRETSLPALITHRRLPGAVLSVPCRAMMLVFLPNRLLFLQPPRLPVGG